MDDVEVGRKRWKELGEGELSWGFTQLAKGNHASPNSRRQWDESHQHRPGLDFADQSKHGVLKTILRI